MTILTDDDFELFTRFKIRAMGDKLHGDHRRRILRPRGVRGENQTHARTPGTEARGARKIAGLIRQARFKYKDACVEDIEYPPERKPGRDRIERLASCQWVRDRETLIIIPRHGKREKPRSARPSATSHAAGNPHTIRTHAGHAPGKSTAPGSTARPPTTGRSTNSRASTCRSWTISRPRRPTRRTASSSSRSWRHAARPAPRPAPANANPSNGT